MFAQRSGQNPNALARFQNALEQDGFDVSTGAAGSEQRMSAPPVHPPFPRKDFTAACGSLAFC